MYLFGELVIYVGLQSIINCFNEVSICHGETTRMLHLLVVFDQLPSLATWYMKDAWSEEFKWFIGMDGTTIVDIIPK